MSPQNPLADTVEVNDPENECVGTAKFQSSYRDQYIDDVIIRLVEHRLSTYKDDHEVLSDSDDEDNDNEDIHDTETSNGHSKTEPAASEIGANIDDVVAVPDNCNNDDNDDNDIHLGQNPDVNFEYAGNELRETLNLANTTASPQAKRQQPPVYLSPPPKHPPSLPQPRSPDSNLRSPPPDQPSSNQSTPVKSTPTKLSKVRLGQFDKIRRRLSFMVAPSSMVGREKEHDEIYSKVIEYLRSGLSSAMFVYGVPGTGKTATVKSVMRRIRDEGEYSFEYIEVNGMRLSSPRMAYNYLWKQLQGGLDVTDKTSLKPNAALARLNEFFSENSKTNINASSSGGSTSSNKKKKAPRNIILLLDEMDLLVTKDQGVLYNFFQWTTMPGSRLFVAGIANTMNLPQILSQKIGSRMGTNRLSFVPYTFIDLQKILESRLGKHRKVFQDGTLAMIARKEALATGDARRTLELCERALTFAELSKVSMVTMEHVQRAASRNHHNPKIVQLSNAPRHLKILMCSILVENQYRQKGVATISMGHINRRYAIVCEQLTDIAKLPFYQVCEAVECLGKQRFVDVNWRDRGSPYQQVVLQTERKEVLDALEEDGDGFGNRLLQTLNLK